MEFTKNFKKVVEEAVNNNLFVGTGNPNAKILIIGKEVATDNINSDLPIEKANLINYNNNASDWKKNIKDSISQEDVKDWIYNSYIKDPEAENNPLFAFKGVKLIDHKEGITWRKYQKLHDIIFNGGISTDLDRDYDFQRNFFITEMNDSPCKKTSLANKDGIKSRKDFLLKSEFIQQFPVVILACGEYITNYGNNREIDDYFGVSFDDNGEHHFSDSNKFWTHHNTSGDKLVIHTRQLSANVKNEMLEQMGDLIRKHLELVK